MGWQPESTMFRCKPEIAGDLKLTARSYGHCCGPERLWVEMLRNCDRRGVQAEGRTNLTQLLHSCAMPEVLPAWGLTSKEVRELLVVDESGQVFLTKKRSRPVMRISADPEQTEQWRMHREKIAAAEQKLQALQESGAAEAAAKQDGLLLSDPPLPAELLRLLPTADMLSLSRVCKGLQVAAYELLRREEAAFRSTDKYLGGVTEYVPLQVREPVAATMLELSVADRPAAAAPVKRELSLTNRRYMRALSVLYGTPEAAAAMLAKAKADKGSDLKIVVGKKYDRTDEQIFTACGPVIKGIILCRSNAFDDPYRCVLYTVQPSLLPEVISLFESITWRGGFSQTCIDSVLESAKVAHKNGEVLCLLYTLW